MYRFYTSALRPLQLIMLLSVFFSFPPAGSHAQHAYDLKLSRDLPLLGTGVVGTTASVLLRNRNAPLTADDLGTLNAEDIFAIDQSATTYYGNGARLASDIFLSMSYAFPLASLLADDIRSDPGTIGVMLAEAITINEALTGITKAVIKRPRPFTYNQEVPENIRTARASNYSFFSGHTSYTATLSFFTAKVISDNIENNTTKALVWSGAILWPAATGYFRYKAGMHFPTDVITGYIVGATVGFLIPQLHRKKEESEDLAGTQQQLRIAPGMVGVVITF